MMQLEDWINWKGVNMRRLWYWGNREESIARDILEVILSCEWEIQCYEG